jgi:signal recognition particle GTPase
LVQKAWTISKAPVKMDTQPMNMVLITVTSMTSPSTKNPATIMTSPSRTQTQNGGAGRLVTPIGELLSYVVMSFSSFQAIDRCVIASAQPQPSRAGRGATQTHGDVAATSEANTHARRQRRRGGGRGRPGGP